LGRYRSHRVRGKRTEVQFVQKCVTFALIAIEHNGSELRSFLRFSYLNKNKQFSTWFLCRFLIIAQFPPMALLWLIRIHRRYWLF